MVIFLWFIYNIMGIDCDAGAGLPGCMGDGPQWGSGLADEGRGQSFATFAHVQAINFKKGVKKPPDIRALVAEESKYHHKIPKSTLYDLCI